MNSETSGVLQQIARGGFYIPSVVDTGLSGQIIGDVELVRLLANGATSDVWEGVNRITREPVAVKIACRNDDAGLRARFEHEAELLETSLVSDGPESPFPRYYGHGEYEGRPYLVTEQLEDVNVPETSDAFGGFLLEVIDAVEVLHRNGYIHQDLKPANMMRRREGGRLVLIDFGQAHRIEKGRLTPQPNSLTMDASGHRTATGTAGYCAPEQLDAERTAFLPATDVYALGMLIRNFCGRSPEWRQVGSDATDPDLRRRIPDVETLRRRVMFKASKNRRNAMRDLLQDLEIRRSRGRGLVHVGWERLTRRQIVRKTGTQAPGLVRIVVPSMFRYVVDEALHLTGPVVVRVFGSGTLDLDVSADRDVLFVISGDVTVINRSARQTGVDYFVNNGGLLCFPQIAEQDSEEVRRHVHLASFDGAFVHFGSGTSRDEINARYRQDWEEAIASGDSEAFALLKESRFSRPDDGVPIVLRR
ncbi:MAG: protein kinase [Kiritimatiellae bacterium]|nr:protein kinase [Kiritimatiellia bacterium]